MPGSDACPECGSTGPEGCPALTAHPEGCRWRPDLSSPFRVGFARLVAEVQEEHG